VQKLGEKAPREQRRRPRALVLVPTRELAAQVSDQMQYFGRRLSLRSTKIYGGVNIRAQMERLHQGVDMVVATPGRLLDHIEKGTINLSRIEFLVLDEADRMLDLGFIDDILKVAEYLPVERQTLLFSATYSQSIKQLADELLDEPRRIEVARKNIAADAVSQAVYAVQRSRKTEMLSHLIESQKMTRVLVFARTRYGADKLTEELLLNGIKAAAIHSNKSQSVRTRTLAEFKRGDLRVLVATDVAARGLDIQHLPHVVNYDLPQVAEDYVHRIGRTGRAGEEGVAVSLVCPEELSLLQAIEALLKYAIPRQALAEFPKVDLKAGGRIRATQTPNRPTSSRKAPGKPRDTTVKSGKPRDTTVKSRKLKSKPGKSSAAKKNTPTRRTKASTDRFAPKNGRRGGRS
jgi:ATP-dependent RNA helicase RhlE